MPVLECVAAVRCCIGAEFFAANVLRPVGVQDAVACFERRLLFGRFRFLFGQNDVNKIVTARTRTLDTLTKSQVLKTPCDPRKREQCDGATPGSPAELSLDDNVKSAEPDNGFEQFGRLFDCSGRAHRDLRKLMATRFV